MESRDGLQLAAAPTDEDEGDALSLLTLFSGFPGGGRGLEGASGGGVQRLSSSRAAGEKLPRRQVMTSKWQVGGSVKGGGD